MKWVIKDIKDGRYIIRYKDSDKYSVGNESNANIFVTEDMKEALQVYKQIKTDWSGEWAILKHK